MPPDPIVITLDITEDFRTSLFDRFKNAAFDQLCLKARKETLGFGVIVTTACAAHRLPKAVNIKQSAIFHRSILAAAVGMNNRPSFYQTTPPRTIESINDNLRRHSLRNLPADNPARVFILKCRQITELSILQWQIGNVADQDFALTTSFIQ